MRNTPLLEAVKSIFESFNKPMTVPQILESLKSQNISPNKTSLYRMLEKLKKEEFIEDLILDSKTVYYELKTHHHHHFSCNDCGTINCIEDQELEKNIHALETKLRKKGLVVQNHNFSFSGLCETCAA